jgi:class 3 adenylate cyclase
VGDAVNVAQRLQAEADGGVILASAATVALTRGFSTEAMGPIRVKGRRAPVDGYRVLGVGSDSTGG